MKAGFFLGSRARNGFGGCTRRMGLGRLGKLRVAGDVAYLLCAASLHHADRMADERRRFHCRDDENKGNLERRGNVPMPRLR